MKFLQGTWANRFNRYRGLVGRPFQGRYKALYVEPGGCAGAGGELHPNLNPVRAKIAEVETLDAFRWSSLWWFPQRKERPARLCPETVLTLPARPASTAPHAPPRSPPPANAPPAPAPASPRRPLRRCGSRRARVPARSRPPRGRTAAPVNDPDTASCATPPRPPRASAVCVWPLRRYAATISAHCAAVWRAILVRWISIPRAYQLRARASSRRS